MKKNNFITCGLTGWCMEIIFTSLHCLQEKDHKLVGKTSIWMFPIYGSAAIICPLYKWLKPLPTICRGGIYTLGIYAGEYLSGSLLRRHDMCPWDYSDAKYNIHGLIRLDYAPLWFAAGLLFEKLVTSEDEPLP